MSYSSNPLLPKARVWAINLVLVDGLSVGQADNGAEFGKGFEEALATNGTRVRHSRVRKPNDNAFIERFNRTIQEACIHKYDPEESSITRKVLTYLARYNDERLHLGLQCRTPLEMLQRS